MFHDLDATLAALVRAELPIKGVDVSFLGPDQEFPPSGVRLPAISFFLYDIREDVQRRSNLWETERPDDRTVVKRRPAVRVACSYLITAWPSDKVTDPARDEHQLLGALLRVLLRHRKIPDAYLAGELRGQEPPMPSRILATNQLQSLGEFWQAMGGKPKAALHYGITVAMDVGEPLPPVPVVQEGGHQISLDPIGSP